MFKALLTALLALWTAAALAAVEVNQASLAELEAVKGVGTAMAGKILDERQRGAFKDWPDLVERVKGIGAGNAARFSAAGLTVNGAAFTGAATVPVKR
jgi:competence protein ComEA